MKSFDCFPIVTLIGRPNVGKSTLFNTFSQSRVAITEDEAGTTRDYLCREIDREGRRFFLIDTAGIREKRERRGELAHLIFKRTCHLIERSHCILFVVDYPQGVTAMDLRLASLLHREKKPTLLVVNKCEEREEEREGEFAQLGFSSSYFLSALRFSSLSELNRDLACQLASLSLSLRPSSLPRREISLSLVGRPNVGKSTLFNALLEEERVLVSSEAGTTQDAIEEKFVREDILYRVVDTAGVRKKKNQKRGVEKKARWQLEQRLCSNSISLLLIDAALGIGVEEKRLFGKIKKGGGICIWVVNKWDQMRGVSWEEYKRALHQSAPFLMRQPILPISARERLSLPSLFSLIDRWDQESQKRISTGLLNRTLSEVMQNTPPPLLQGRRLKIFYATQTGSSPVEISCFVNEPALAKQNYQRCLISHLREKLFTEEIPLIIHYKKRI